MLLLRMLQRKIVTLWYDFLNVQFELLSLCNSILDSAILVRDIIIVKLLERSPFSPSAPWVKLDFVSR